MRQTSITLLLIAMVGTAEVVGQSRLRLPFVDEGACPFEGCTYRAWSVLVDTSLRADRRDDASIVAEVRAGVMVQAVTGVVVTTTLGQAVVVRSTTVGDHQSRVERGETIALLNYRGEGEFKYWLRGIIDVAFIPDKESCARSLGLFNECAIQMGKLPTCVWWVKIRTADGREGWTREVDHFGNKDRFGD